MSRAAHHDDGHNQDDDFRTPLLKKGMPKPAVVSNRISLLLQDWWLWEILSAIVAVLATSAIVVILVLYDNSSLPDWPSVFTVRCSSIGLAHDLLAEDKISSIQPFRSLLS